MNIKDLHIADKPVSTMALFHTDSTSVYAIRLLKDALLKAHTSPVRAILVCLSGSASYEDENEQLIDMKTGDYTIIEPLVKHWINAIEETQLLLIK
jgi:quercetin dioxygenase-like cupin family protein